MTNWHGGMLLVFKVLWSFHHLHYTLFLAHVRLYNREKSSDHMQICAVLLLLAHVFNSSHSKTSIAQ